MKKIFILFLVVFIFLNYSSTYAIETNKLVSVNQSANSMSITGSSPGLTEADAYKLMYKNVVDYNSKILDTVYWALSAMLVLTLALFGSNIFFNYRTNRKEIENIISGMKLELQEFKNQIFNEVQKKLNEFIGSSNEELKLNFGNTVENQSEQIKLITNNLTSQINAFTSIFEDKVKNLEKSITDNVDSIKNNYLKLNSEIKKTKKEIEIDLFDLNAAYAKDKKVYANAFRFYLREISNQLELDLSIDWSLNNLIQVLQLLDHMPSYYVTDFNVILSKIPIQYEIQKMTISERVKSMPIK